MLENGKTKCNCTKTSCERHGKCEECMNFHKANKRPPYCKRENYISKLFKIK